MGRTRPQRGGESPYSPRMNRSTPRRGGILRKVLIALVLLIVVAVVGGVLFLDSIVKAGIGAAGTHVLGVNTSVKDVSIGIVSGKT